MQFAALATESRVRRLSEYSPVSNFFGKLRMASPHSDECKEHGKNVSARTFRRTWSTNSSDGYGGHSTKSCVCAPTTHAGSFKCRLHRVYGVIMLNVPFS
ncbi:hypothetical protein H6P81_013499 [Aristolochia fimbriata]|uniref:Uncharacterized protein n=1 Tax=Aristolochia fimbriata TaxID=158543 RepID=A0AAV7EHQ8_ARIFI|nr:hypothetical protein H6P81_013499 [Aristolochia fimbriata]